MGTGDLPCKGVLFLGGHRNMVKKLQQRYPAWSYITDDQFRHRGVITQQIVFCWSAHSSHKMTQFVWSKLRKDASVYYVKATNLCKLEVEMKAALQEKSSDERLSA